MNSFSNGGAFDVQAKDLPFKGKTKPLTFDIIE